MTKSIIIYVDQGVSGPALLQVVKNLQTEANLLHHPLRRMDANTLKNTEWEKDTALLIMPGGKDVYYNQALAGVGAQKIRSFVARGGNYLGLCAGAYFAAEEIEFEKGGYLEVCGKRPLEFFPGVAKGPAYGPNKYSYENEKGAEAALICVGEEECHVYFNGGCYFENPQRHPHVQVIGDYVDLEEQKAAIIECRLGVGKAILSGVHLEFSSRFLSPDKPYIHAIYPLLKKSEEKRRALFRQLLQSLEIKLM